MGSKSENRAKHGHILVWDQPGIQEPEYLTKKKGKIGSRHMVTFMLFLGMANAYVMRTNMSVAIVAMVNHTALPKKEVMNVEECGSLPNDTMVEDESEMDGEYIWDSDLQAYILSSFFYGYVVTQIPFGILAKKYGARGFLGFGMLINSVFAFLVPVSADWGLIWLCITRFIQGLGEGPIVPCTHALLAKWIPPNERSRMGAFIYSGAQFGTVVSMPLSGLLARYGFAGGWPSIFYVFGAISTIWSILFLFMVAEDPESDKRIDPEEKKLIMTSLWGSAEVSSSPPVPWKSIVKSLPFWAILFAHMGQNYGYETLMTELPTFMKQILHFNIQANGTLSALPYLAMWIFSIIASNVADWTLEGGGLGRITVVRKIMNSIGQFGAAIALVIASYTGCNPTLTVAVLTIGVGLNGAIYSGFKVNHLDISPRFAGILMSLTNCTANLTGLIAPIAAGYIVKGKPTQEEWRKVFIISAVVYAVCASIFLMFASGRRQPWDKQEDDPKIEREKEETQTTNLQQITTTST